MAYSLGDPYRTIRLVLRINGIVLGLTLGALLFLGSPAIVRALGFVVEGGALSQRLAGAGLIAAGAFMLGGAGRRTIDSGVLAPSVLFHALMAVALLIGYLRGEVAVTNLTALVFLLGAFLLCLVGAIAPLRYFGAEFRA